MDNDVDTILRWRKSPLSFIHDQWGLTPQPLLTGVRDDLPAEQYGEQHFAPFVLGKHITWQQWLFFRAVEWAVANKAPRFISVRSGHGTAKSADMAILILWFLACWDDSQVPCTAPTADQLYDVLWKEIAKWLRQMPGGFSKLYHWSTQYVRMVESPETWFARARTARKEAPEALAGIHARCVLIPVDEASGVPEEIFETAQGALTNEFVLFVMMSNPTRLSGYFFDSHHRNKERFQCLQFDSEKSPLVDKAFVKRMEEQYGRESPQFLVRVKGEFPTTEEDQLIPFDLFDSAAQRDFPPPTEYPRIGSTDVARYGDDATTHGERQGNVAKILGERRGQDTMATCGDIVRYIRAGEESDNPYDYWCIDVIGLGAGVYDRCKELQAEGVIPRTVKLVAVNVSEKPMNDREFSGMRAELYSAAKKWLETGSIDPAYRDQLCAIKYKAPDSRGRLVLEKKEDMKERGLPSPDRADQFVITFSVADRTRESREKAKSALRARNRVRKQSGAWWA